jgi:hypothetical protein
MQAHDLACKAQIITLFFIEPRGSICCPSILSRHSLFPLFSFLKLPLVLLIRKNSNAWSYKTGKSSETRKTETKRKIPNVEEVLQENIPERKLWSPKDNKKSRDLGIQVAPRILEARHREFFLIKLLKVVRVVLLPVYTDINTG